jgi:hypothetical protein
MDITTGVSTVATLIDSEKSYFLALVFLIIILRSSMKPVGKILGSQVASIIGLIIVFFISRVNFNSALLITILYITFVVVGQGHKEGYAPIDEHPSEVYTIGENYFKQNGVDDLTQGKPVPHSKNAYTLHENIDDIHMASGSPSGSPMRSPLASPKGVKSFDDTSIGGFEKERFASF